MSQLTRRKKKHNRLLFRCETCSTDTSSDLFGETGQWLLNHLGQGSIPEHVRWWVESSHDRVSTIMAEAGRVCLIFHCFNWLKLVNWWSFQNNWNVFLKGLFWIGRPWSCSLIYLQYDVTEPSGISTLIFTKSGRKETIWFLQIRVMEVHQSGWAESYCY